MIQTFRPIRHASLLSALILLWLPYGVEAKEKLSRIERWQAEIQEIDAKQREGKARSAKRALRDAEKLFEEVRQRGWREPALKGILAEISTQLAIAMLNLDQGRERAIWLFHGALLLDKEIGERDWAPYGRAGRVLAELERRPLRGSPPGRRVLGRPFPRGFERPRQPEVEGEDVVLPMNRHARNERRIVKPTIEVAIWKDGSVSHPTIVLGHSAKPTVLLAVLDMIWYSAPYVPGRLEGEPVDLLYEISIDDLKFDRWDEMVVYY